MQKTITVRLDKDLVDKIDLYCEKNRYKKKSDFYRDLIDRFISIQEQQDNELNDQLKEGLNGK
jgi:Arc/MetJ-type ribon-helix-helix transcriptional regulator